MFLCFFSNIKIHFKIIFYLDLFHQACFFLFNFLYFMILFIYFCVLKIFFKKIIFFIFFYFKLIFILFYFW
jgi:hypothetical protein